jgi:hypothetical protein
MRVAVISLFEIGWFSFMSFVMDFVSSECFSIFCVRVLGGGEVNITVFLVFLLHTLIAISLVMFFWW